MYDTIGRMGTAGCVSWVVHKTLVLENLLVLV